MVYVLVKSPALKFYNIGVHISAGTHISAVRLVVKNKGSNPQVHQGPMTITIFL